MGERWGEAVENRVIVVAEDDKAVRELLAVTLSTELSAQVLLAPNGMRLLELVRQVRPAVVLTDVRMPALDGLEATRRLHSDPTTARVPVVAVSAKENRAAALAAGCWAFVAKPFDVAELVRLVGDLMAVRAPDGEGPGETAPAVRLIEDIDARLEPLVDEVADDADARDAARLLARIDELLPD